jgi:hypothetical protein
MIAKNLEDIGMMILTCFHKKTFRKRQRKPRFLTFGARLSSRRDMHAPQRGRNGRDTSVESVGVRVFFLIFSKSFNVFVRFTVKNGPK